MSGEHVQILETERTVTAGCIPTLPVAVSVPMCRGEHNLGCPSSGLCSRVCACGYMCGVRRSRTSQGNELLRQARLAGWPRDLPASAPAPRSQAGTTKPGFLLWHLGADSASHVCMAMPQVSGLGFLRQGPTVWPRLTSNS